MNAPLFSIVVPCCDVAGCIPAMADSLLKQRCRDFECLLVVEDSADETLTRCRELTAADPRFRIHTRPRSGSPAAPRNDGIAMACGEYVLLLDGDDWLEPDALERIKSVIDRHDRPEVIQGAANEIREDGEGKFTFIRRLFNYRPEDDGRIFTGQEATIHLAQLHVNPYPVAWLNICRLDFLRRHALQFIPGLCFEDEEWTPRVIYSASRLAVMNFAFYNYRRRADSVTMNRNINRLPHYAVIVKSLLRFHAEHPFYPALSRAWGRNLLSFFYCFFFYPKHARQNSRKTRQAVLREILGDPHPYRQLIRHASAAHKATALVVLSARWTMVPADLFFRFIYYPLAVRKGRER